MTWKYDLDENILSTTKQVQNLGPEDIDMYGNSLKNTMLTDSEELDEDAEDSEFEFKTVFSATYFNWRQEDIDEWLIARPSFKGIVKSKSGESDFRSNEYYQYYDKGEMGNNGIEGWPFVKQIITAPEPAHDLSVYSLFEYDNFGHIVKKTLQAPRFEVDEEPYPIEDRITEYKYSNSAGYDGRFLTETWSNVNAALYKTKYEYDLVLGKVSKKTSYDQLITSFEYDDFGNIDYITQPNGTIKFQQIGWSDGHEYEPEEGASYYKYTYTLSASKQVATEQEKTIIFYDKFNREIRRVTFDINNQAIYVDKKYTDNIYGKKEHISEPYLSGLQANQWTVFKHDELGRIISTTLPNGNIITKEYRGNLTITFNQGTSIQKRQMVDAMGQIISTIDPTGTITYDYFSSGKIKQINALDAITTMTYDDAGRQKTLTDPDAGQISYIYDPFGELIRQTDGNNNQYDMKYDEAGRLYEKKLKSTGETTSYIFNDYPTPPGGGYPPGEGFGKLSTIIGYNGFEYRYFYDNLNRLFHKVEVHPETGGGQTLYNAYYSYDISMGRLNTYTFPSDFKVKYDYADNGKLKKVTKYGETQPLWENLSVNPRGQITDFALGNGLSTHKEFDDYGFPESIVTGSVQDLSYTFNSTTGNLEQRKDNIYHLTEDFSYDEYMLKNRLVEWGENSDEKFNTIYGSNGNIQCKTDATVYSPNCYNYNSVKPHAVTDIVYPTDEYLAEASIPQSITYTAFNKVSNITHSDHGNITDLFIEYGPDETRKIIRLYETAGSIRTLKKEKHYAMGDYEEIIDAYGNERKLHYLNAGDGLFAIYVQNGENDTIYYIHKDYLGSYEAITADGGVVKDKLNFDPWGRSRNPLNWKYEDSPWPHLFDRGFTGHEHLDNFNLINMNGRIYDPWVGRFLSPDIFVQSQDNSQDFNRYSYALNNPLLFTDPSGNDYGIALDILFTYLYNAYSNRDKETGQWDWNPVDWFNNDGNSSFYAGVNINGDGNFTAYGGIGNENIIPSIAYNNEYGFGYGVASPSGGGSGFYYLNSNNSTLEANALNNIYKASAEGYNYQKEQLFDYDQWMNEFYQSQMERYSFPDQRYISAAIKLYIGDYDDQFRKAAKEPLRFIAELNPIISMSNAAKIMYSGENMYNDKVSSGQRWIAAPATFIVSIPGVGALVRLEDGSLIIVQIVMNEATK